MPLTPMFALKASGCLAVIAIVAITRISPKNHPYAALGAANYMTAVRALLVALVAAVIGEPHDRGLAWTVTGVALAATVLDGLDGWLARRSGMSSAFGARFDMEVDALLIMALSVLAWTWGKAGAWVLASGLLRYAFVVSGWIRPWMERPLLPSRRRQTVCVIQICALISVVTPVVPPATSEVVAAAALVALAASFLLDTAWLVRHRQEQVA